MDYVALGLDAMTAPRPRDASGALMGVEGEPSALTIIGAGLATVLAVMGLGVLQRRVRDPDVRAAAYRAALIEKGIDPTDPAGLVGALEHVKLEAAGSKWGMSIPKVSATLNKQMIVRALEQTGYNRTHAANLLGRSRRWLLYALKEYGIQVPERAVTSPDDAAVARLERQLEAVNEKLAQARAARGETVVPVTTFVRELPPPMVSQAVAEANRAENEAAEASAMAAAAEVRAQEARAGVALAKEGSSPLPGGVTRRAAKAAAKKIPAFEVPPDEPEPELF